MTRLELHSTEPSKPPTEWPISGLDVAALTAGGWHPAPVTQFILKLSSICQLACDYCYVYESADVSWAGRPRFMSSRVMEVAATEIARHAAHHDLARVSVVIHGGEPFLAGQVRIAELVDGLRAAVSPISAIDFVVQTNGGLVNAEVARFCLDRSIRIGVSLDGSPEAHDRHRRTRAGHGSYADTAQAVELLASPEFRPIFSGLLCTVDVTSRPLQVYRSLLRYSPPHIDFLLPHRTWSTAGPAPAGGEAAAWLSKICDVWFAEDRIVGVRLFEEIIALLLGGSSRSDQVGLSPSTMAVIDTDGSLQQVDALKVAYEGAPETGMDIFHHSIDEFLWHPGVVARQIGREALSDQCSECRLVSICGGGHYPHRYRRGQGFRNPSVYCTDLMLLIDHIRDLVADSLRA